METPVSSNKLSSNPQILLKKLHETDISNETKLTQYTKMNSRTLTKLNFELIFSLYGGYQFQPKLPTRKAFRKIASLLRQEKLTSSLIFFAQPMTAPEITFLASKLKYLKHLTSLDMRALGFCTPRLLKFLSMALNPLTKLSYLSITFPKDIIMTPQLIISLFFALKRLNSLTSLSLSLLNATLDQTSCEALTLCLSKLVTLKSLTLTLTSTKNLSPYFLSFIAPSFKKLVLLQDLSICLQFSGSLESQAILDFFTSIKGLKSVRSLALNLGGCTFTSKPILEGLSFLSSSRIQSLDFKYDSERDDAFFQDFGKALQKFASLRDLRLDLTGNQKISDRGLSQFASSLQTLHSLSSLRLELYLVQYLTTSVQIIGTALKPLVKLKSLDLDFNALDMTDDRQLFAFSDGLQNLTALQNLSLKFAQMKKITDDSFGAFSTALKNLTELSTLNLELAHMEKLTSKGMVSLASAIGNLTKLKDLSINCLGNKNFDQESTESLGRAFQNLSLLTSVSLDFLFCQSLKGGGDKFLAIFKALDGMKFLEKIDMALPSKDYNEKDYQLCTRHVRNQKIFWY